MKNLAHPVLLGVVIAGVWLNLHWEYLAASWFLGTDALVRLYYIDELFVVFRGNPWLPGLQLYLKLIASISDSVLAYKIGLVLPSLAVIVLLTTLLARLLSPTAALLSSLYFFFHYHWKLVAFSAYMEPLFLFFLLIAAHLLRAGMRCGAALAVAIASFVRPEVLLGAPVWLFLSYYWKRSLRDTALAAAFLFPSLCYYLVNLYSRDSFSPPFSPSLSGSLEVLSRMTRIWIDEPYGIAVVVLAACTILRLLFGKGIAQRKIVLFVAGGWILFLTAFLILIPALNPSSFLNSRSSIWVVLPLFVLASLTLERVLQRTGRLQLPIVLLFWSSAVFLQVRDDYYPVSSFYAVAQRIVGQLGDEHSVNICLQSEGSSGYELEGEHGIWPLSVYLRFAEKDVAKTDCNGEEGTLPLISLFGRSDAEQKRFCPHEIPLYYYGERIASVCVKLSGTD